MKRIKRIWGGSRWGKWALIAAAAVVLAVVSLPIYISLAFPESRCEYVDHLKSPDAQADCFNCHIKTTPKVAQDWYESKHGVILVKCFVCHGQPDGKGSVPYAVSPNIDTTCRKCHDPSINKMEKKYGLVGDCYLCHPFHNNSLHHKAYVKPIAKKKID